MTPKCLATVAFLLTGGLAHAWRKVSQNLEEVSASLVANGADVVSSSQREAIGDSQSQSLSSKPLFSTSFAQGSLLHGVSADATTAHADAATTRELFQWKFANLKCSVSYRDLLLLLAGLTKQQTFDLTHASKKFPYRHLLFAKFKDGEEHWVLQGETAVAVNFDFWSKHEDTSRMVTCTTVLVDETGEEKIEHCRDLDQESAASKFRLSAERTFMALDDADTAAAYIEEQLAVLLNPKDFLQSKGIGAWLFRKKPVSEDNTYARRLIEHVRSKLAREVEKGCEVCSVPKMIGGTGRGIGKRKGYVEAQCKGDMYGDAIKHEGTDVNHDAKERMSLGDEINFYSYGEGKWRKATVVGVGSAGVGVRVQDNRVDQKVSWDQLSAWEAGEPFFVGQLVAVKHPWKDQFALGRVVDLEVKDSLGDSVLHYEVQSVREEYFSTSFATAVQWYNADRANTARKANFRPEQLRELSESEKHAPAKILPPGWQYRESSRNPGLYLYYNEATLSVQKEFPEDAECTKAEKAEGVCQLHLGLQEDEMAEVSVRHSFA